MKGLLLSLGGEIENEGNRAFFTDLLQVFLQIKSLRLKLTTGSFPVVID